MRSFFGKLEFEDYTLTLVTLVAWAPSPYLYYTLFNDPSLAGWREAVFLVVCAGYWSVIAGQLDIRSIPVPSRLRHRRIQVLMLVACLSQAFSLPFFFYLLSDGDTGIILVYTAFWLTGAAGAWVFSLVRRKRRQSFLRRRIYLLPLTLVSAVYCFEFLGSRFVFAYPGQITEAILIGRKDQLGLYLIEVALKLVVFIFPYIVLVVFPRLLAGEVFDLKRWYSRFGWFLGGWMLTFLLLTLRGM